MIVSSRVEERMNAAGLSQSELARRVGVSQPTIYKLLRQSKKGSTHLHRIARELGTTPEYLSGEIDDPDLDAPPPAPELPIVIRMDVVLPPVAALERMFEGLLATIDPAASRDELAQLLARRLPIGLSRLRDLRVGSVTPPVGSEGSAEVGASLTTADPEHQR